MTQPRIVALPSWHTLATHIIVVALLACAMLLLTDAPIARAYEEPNSLGGTGVCAYCHPPGIWPDMDCDSCHGDDDDPGIPGYAEGSFGGPHGGYTTGTSKCENCHTVHTAPIGVMLLPEPTIVDTCSSCHDGTGGEGVYNVIGPLTGTEPAGGHSVYDPVSVIPGGDAATGGDSTGTLNGPGGTLICTDCHSPHGSDVVNAFLGDRRRIRNDHPAVRSSRLLRQQPTGATTATADYGSDWCLGCHAGRSSGGMVMNHPVDSEVRYSTETTEPYTYDNVAILASDDPTSATTIGPMGGVSLGTGFTTHDWPGAPDAADNRGYLMPDNPRSPDQEGRGPICQQCHEDTRSVGELTGDGSIADAEAAQIRGGDGVYWSGGTWVEGWSGDNPGFQNFPHETMNANMLVEEYDNLCMNCHSVTQLP